MASKPSSMDMLSGLKNMSPKSSDASMGKRGGPGVNDDATRSSPPKVASIGPRSA